MFREPRGMADCCLVSLLVLRSLWVADFVGRTQRYAISFDGGVGLKGYRRYFFNKLGWFAITFVFAFLLNFMLPRLMPGDPVAAIVAGRLKA